MDDSHLEKAIDDLRQLFPRLGPGEAPTGWFAILNNLKMLVRAFGG